MLPILATSFVLAKILENCLPQVLYRQFLALLSASQSYGQKRIERIWARYGGLIWAVDALQPAGGGRLLYVLYEVQSGTPISAFQSDHATEAELRTWLEPYQNLPYRVLATLSDGEKAIVAALQATWPQAPHQRCQLHFLNNLAEAILSYDDQLRLRMGQDLGSLPPVPENQTEEGGTETLPAPFPGGETSS